MVVLSVQISHRKRFNREVYHRYFFIIRGHLYDKYYTYDILQYSAMKFYFKTLQNR